MGRKITKKEFNETVMAYAMDTVMFGPAPGSPERIQWGFYGEPPRDERTFATEDAAKRAAEWYIRNRCPDRMAIGRNEAREWMKYNGYHF
mgnify:CR=1 FL=1